jgi:hypothetical protein
MKLIITAQFVQTLPNIKQSVATQKRNILLVLSEYIKLAKHLIRNSTYNLDTFSEGKINFSL